MVSENSPSASNLLAQLPPVALPNSVPDNLPRPKFQLGEAVYWREVPDSDFGRVIGVLYTHEATHRITGLHYLILLDTDSPSSSICAHDLAFEDDLERLELSERAL